MRVFIVSFILITIFSLLPFHDIEGIQTEECVEIESHACFVIRENCKSLRPDTDNIIDPIEQFMNKGAGDLAVGKCFEQRYNTNCISCSGENLGWFDQFLANGPWYLDEFPELKQLWQKKVTSYIDL